MSPDAQIRVQQTADSVSDDLLVLSFSLMWIQQTVNQTCTYLNLGNSSLPALYPSINNPIQYLATKTTQSIHHSNEDIMADSVSLGQHRILTYYD